MQQKWKVLLTVASELIQYISKEILDTLLDNIRKTREYSIIFDQTTAISHRTQHSSNMGHITDGEISEDFVGCVQRPANYESDEDDGKEARGPTMTEGNE
ncbi:hypothetical protein JTB14_011380 [Gonioctena quinquepunctata]|nr:hypothetical protein JTB14_011380 [Gonioctena quinquepunctata]